MKMKYSSLLMVFLIVFFISGCSTQTITKYQCQNGQVVDSIDLCEEQKCPICPEKICQMVEEPYVETTSYTYDFKYVVASESTGGGWEGINYVKEQTTTIKNLEDMGGQFTVNHHYRTLKKEGDKEISHYLESGETKEFKTTFDTSLGEDVEVTTEIIPPSETRYKEEIKYKEVERCSCE